MKRIDLRYSPKEAGTTAIDRLMNELGITEQKWGRKIYDHFRGNALYIVAEVPNEKRPMARVERGDLRELADFNAKHHNSALVTPANVSHYCEEWTQGAEYNKPITVVAKNGSQHTMEMYLFEEVIKAELNQAGIDAALNTSSALKERQPRITERRIRTTRGVGKDDTPVGSRRI
jgi:hypothetical protein